MLIREEALKHWIEHFYGYGSWQAKCWFVAYEEGGGDTPEEVADKLNYFHHVHTSDKDKQLCDIRDLYRQVNFRMDGPRSDLFSNLFDYRFGPYAVQHGAWKNLIAFVHGYQNLSLPDLLTYQKNSLASPSLEREALLRFYPLPAHNHAWYYSWLELPQLPFLKSRAAYQEHVYPGRIQYILENMDKYHPDVVVMYGMNNIDRLKKSIKAIYPGTQFKMVKALKQVIPQHHRADIGATTLLITTQLPQLRHNRIETGFDWYEFGVSVKDTFSTYK